MKGLKDVYVLWTVALLLAVGGVVGLYLPQRQARATARVELTTARALLVEKAAQGKRVAALYRRNIRLQEELRGFDKQLPSHTELGRFLREISQSVEDEQLTKQVVEPQNPIDRDIYKTLPIQMKFDGSFEALFSFLRRIEAMTRLTHVNALEVRNDEALDGNVNVQLMMNIYFTER